MISRLRITDSVTKFSFLKGWELAEVGGENGEWEEGLKRSFRIMKDGNDFFFVLFVFFLFCPISFHGTNSSLPLQAPFCPLPSMFISLDFNDFT
jgi:hypothetical protein